MAYELDCVDIRGFRRAHLSQLAQYIHDRDIDGHYNGNRKQFEARHKDLLVFADRLMNMYHDKSLRISK